MKFSNVHDLLLQAGADALLAHDYNKDKPNHMRISRVGQPLVSLLLEDFIFPKLPSLEPKLLTEVQRNGAKVKSLMAQGTGYLFEQVIIDILKQNPAVEILPQHKVKIGSLSGSCDMVVLNVPEARATVVECKALKYSTKKEACTEALFNDSATGYLSQLALYRQALQQEYSLFTVDSCWMVWCKGSASLFKVPFSESKADYNTLEQKAQDKCLEYEAFAQWYKLKNLDKCLAHLPLSSLPLKTPYYSGFSPSCPAHFSPWCNLLVDSNGEPWEEAQEHLTLMLKVCLLEDAQASDTLLKLLQEH